MKKLFFYGICILLLGITQVHSQRYYTGAVGIGIDFGDGETLIGPSGKYFFGDQHAGQAEVLFGDGVTSITLLYEYHGAFSGADGLQWYAGAGPSILLGNNSSSDVGLRPLVGLDYNISDVPLEFSLDWRPYISFDGGSEVARFALGFRYAFD